MAVTIASHPQQDLRPREPYQDRMGEAGQAQSSLIIGEAIGPRPL
jgi:hypothetical protein